MVLVAIAELLQNDGWICRPDHLVPGRDVEVFRVAYQGEHATWTFGHFYLDVYDESVLVFQIDGQPPACRDDCYAPADLDREHHFELGNPDSLSQLLALMARLRRWWKDRR